MEDLPYLIQPRCAFATDDTPSTDSNPNSGAYGRQLSPSVTFGLIKF